MGSSWAAEIERAAKIAQRIERQDTAAVPREV